jgi:hypothetical protein
MQVHKTLLLLAALALTSCGAPGAKNTSTAKPVVSYQDAPRRDGFESILVALPASKAAEQALKGLKYEIEEDFDVVTLTVDKTTKVPDLAKAIADARPSAVVLMNNPTLALYYHYQKSVGGKAPPALAMLSSFLADVVGKLENTGGITYEVPAVTVFPSMRDYISQRIERVGVIHRAALGGFVAKQRALATTANIELVSVEIVDAPKAKDVEKAMRTLRLEGIDAVWVLNDNRLLAPDVLPGWKRALSSGAALPVVVGIRPLIDAQHHFGSFAILPSYDGLGSQAGEMLLNWADENWQGVSGDVQEPVAVEVVVDIGEVRKHFSLKEDMVGSIDVIVE